MSMNKTENNFVAPSVHLNGSDGKLLEKMHENALYTVDKALNEVMELCPEGRDFYPQGPGAYELARKQHKDRVKRLMAVRDELLEILDNIRDQNEARLRDR
jgi:hypothetical protein